MSRLKWVLKARAILNMTDGNTELKWELSKGCCVASMLASVISTTPWGPGQLDKIRAAVEGAAKNE